ncbi:Transcriptional regulatory protein SAP30 [Nakaseomyces bracarensis]|uniref:Transcriptional regulatory protein SAP30 n=1 Tax=Nakaseomyces bracarensis TaxID=273131 RepID=A0ABR4NZ99_9SACH
MARGGNSNSESESTRRQHNGNNSNNASNTTSAGSNSQSSRSNAKQRLTQAQQQYIRELVNEHITNNDPTLIEKPHPLDFEKYSDDFIRAYKDRYNLDIPDHMTLQGYLLGSELGKRTISYKRNQETVPGARITKKEAVEHIKKHFESQSVKEADCVPNFIYKVRNQKKRFRMEFKG